jgi:hypothetical protein
VIGPSGLPKSYSYGSDPVKTLTNGISPFAKF